MVNYGYNSGDQLDLAQLSTGYNYWSVADASFYPNGTPKQVSFGNGVSESTTLNLRLQLQEEAVSSTGIGTLADHSYNYGAQGSNNGNILSVSDLLNSGRTQNFSYDQLNRLATAGEQGGRWGLSFGYDPWGNFLQQNVTAGSAGMHSYTTAANNRLNGYSYDATGNMLGDGFHAYAYDAESRISQVDSGATVYTYDPTGGDRVRKDTGVNYTEYFYFGSEILAERDQNLRWSDYIFANGKRIARADAYEHQLHLSGQMCGNCGWQWYQWGFSNLGSLVGHVVQAGDKLRWRQWLNTGSKGGLIMTMTDGTETWMNGYDILDQNGEEALRSSIYNQWNYRVADLSLLIGKTISQIRLIADGLSTPGQWDMLVEDVVYTQTDGTVQPLYSQGATVPSLYTLGSSGWTNTSAAITDCASGCLIANTTTYYHEDQINSSRLISDGYGYPIWQATFLPYGEEYGPQIGANHYKFGGKERDSESGLDYFGARYYGSALGRWLTPDWAAKATAVPYAEFADPQSLNLYGYVRNIPTTKVDVDGHGCGEMPCDMVPLGDIISDAAKAAWHFLTSGPPGHSLGMPTLPAPNCTCPGTGSQNNNSNNENNNNSYQKNTKADQVKENAAKGKASEQKVLNEKGLTKNTDKVSGTEGKSIPDYQTDKTVGEIKDANNVSNTKQLRIQKEAAGQSGRDHELVTGTNTKVTDNAAKGTNVVRRDDLGPKEQH